MSASVCSQLCVRSSLNAQLGYTQLKDYINTHERKGKRRCTAVQLSDWPKGFTLNASPGDNDCREAQGNGERERQRESERTRRCREKERAMSDAHGLPLPPPSQREDSDVPCPPPPPLCFYSVGGLPPPTNITPVLELVFKPTSFTPEPDQC